MRPPIAPHRFAGPIRLADSVLRRTARWHVDDPHGAIERMRRGDSLVLACRHGQLWPLLWAVRRCNVSIVVSRSPDGELLARVLGGMGFGVVRGSTSRDASTAVRGALRVLREGGRIGVAVDGPRGPLGKVHDGVLRLAQTSGAPIVPILCESERPWIAPGSWDRFEIPRPGQTMRIRLLEPLAVGDGPEALRDAGLQLANRLGGWREDESSSGVAFDEPRASAAEGR